MKFRCLKCKSTVNVSVEFEEVEYDIDGRSVVIGVTCDKCKTQMWPTEKAGKKKEKKSEEIQKDKI